MRAIPEILNYNGPNKFIMSLEQWAKEAEKEIKERAIHEKGLLLNIKVKEVEMKHINDLNMEMAISNPAFYPMKEKIKKLEKELLNYKNTLYRAKLVIERKEPESIVLEEIKKLKQ